MAEYIEREALLKTIDEKFSKHYGTTVYQFIHDFHRCVQRQIRKAPAADVVEVKRGRWIKNAWRDSCSICGFSGSIFDEPIHPYNFCPNCGCLMGGD